MCSNEFLLERIPVNFRILAGQPIIRGRRLAVDHASGKLAAGNSVEGILEGSLAFELK
ncbi:MAG: DUF433 domain-containing protein [Maioricimonas sp. JB049]